VILEEENMTKKIIIVISLAIAAIILLAACERSASQPPLATPTAVGTNTTAQPLGLQHLQDLGTQTAAYVQTQVALGVFTPVPTQGLLLSTPTPAVELTTPGAATLPPLVLATVTPISAVNTPLPVIVVATATPGRPATYVIHAGEFPYCIARRFDVNPSDLLNLNGLSSGELLQPGMTLSIPATGSFPGDRALQAHPTQYTVAVNDTFYTIACAFGNVDPNTIAAANGLAITAPLTTGQILNIP
jgi:LysM repeat protein